MFRTGDRIEIETSSVLAVARVRESRADGRLHVAFEMGEYLPWVDTDVLVRRFGDDRSRSSTAQILHAGSSTALLVVPAAAAKPVTHQLNALGRPRAPFDTLPLLEE